jgi:uncharacterized repeat protein (TIGR04042 family)
MPEVAFLVRWPDGTRLSCRSPSTAIRAHLGSATYEVRDFLSRARAGLEAASARVQAVYGYPCARAAEQLRVIEAQAAPFLENTGARVIVELQ